MHPGETNLSAHHPLAPSEWVIRFGLLVPPTGRILDVACGTGRHAHWFAGRGYLVDAVDREEMPKHSRHIAFKQADIEAGSWPYPGQQFAAVVVANFLYRPLMKTLVEAVAPHGWLIYETFAMGNAKYGRPSQPDFLLQPGELIEAVRGRLRIVAYEDVYVDLPKPAMVQRIAARFVPG